MAPLGPFFPSLWPHMSTLSSNVCSSRRDNYLMCQVGSHECYVGQRQSKTELVISHPFLQEENGNASLQSVFIPKFEAIVKCVCHQKCFGETFPF